MVVPANFLKSQDSKSTFENNLSLIFLCVIPKSKKTVCHDAPCMYIHQLIPYQSLPSVAAYLLTHVCRNLFHPFLVSLTLETDK